jgi:hypothetical protein
MRSSDSTPGQARSRSSALNWWRPRGPPSFVAAAAPQRSTPPRPPAHLPATPRPDFAVPKKRSRLGGGRHGKAGQTTKVDRRIESQPAADREPNRRAGRHGPPGRQVLTEQRSGHRGQRPGASLSCWREVRAVRARSEGNSKFVGLLVPTERRIRRWAGGRHPRRRGKVWVRRGALLPARGRAWRLRLRWRFRGVACIRVAAALPVIGEGIAGERVERRIELVCSGA